ncbi:MAG TPA: aminoacyl-tRNA hydrolase [Deltaproteobacteria bacterium]|nr:aminoacyl-tRNA hydrolase [Deltaproteobacteria bacterium]
MSIHFLGVSMKVIYGLGNPGKQYMLTRHNIGFMVVDLLSRTWHIPIHPAGTDIASGRGQINKAAVMLAKPFTYMNSSGIPLGFLNIQPQDLIVVHDDLDIDFGKVRVKSGGGTGGHKGLDSIISTIGSADFIRIRCGIGRPANGCDPSGYVLGQFTSEEMPVVKEQIDCAAQAAQMCLEEGVVASMNAFNRREKDNSST